ncbi:MAG: hypothetical protein IJU77_08320 [Butyrivibrio sp.]|jgi:hypothetical protein|nr:hypothetical protein [Butyrivibrio sp.]
MELIVAIMFFSLAAAICVRLFASAHFLAEKTESLSNAVIWSQNVAEAFTGNKGDLEKIVSMFPGSYFMPSDSSGREGQLMLFLDENWESVDNSLSEASYEVYLDVAVKSAEEVYSDVKDYGVKLQGDAIVGKILILDVKNVTEDYSSIPQDPDRLILSNSVDAYIGKEGR